MIELYEGPPGSFKTYSIVERCIGTLIKGGVVATNLPLKVDAIRDYLLSTYSWSLGPNQIIILSRDDVPNFPRLTPAGTDTCPVLIVIDEAGRFFNARDWAKVARPVLDFLAVSRHEKNDVIFSDQSSENVDKQFRRLLQYRWRCRDMQKFVIPVLGIPCPLPIYRVGMIDAVSGFEMDCSYRTKKKAIFNLYDSWSKDTCKIDRLEVSVAAHSGTVKKKDFHL